MFLLQSSTTKFCTTLHAEVAGFHGCTAVLRVSICYGDVTLGLHCLAKRQLIPTCQIWPAWRGWHSCIVTASMISFLRISWDAGASAAPDAAAMLPACELSSRAAAQSIAYTRGAPSHKCTSFAFAAGISFESAPPTQCEILVST
jgi:hypothetical protein